MNTPVIGICAVLEPARWGFWEQPAALVADTYLRKVRAAGATAVLLPPDPVVTARPDLVLARIDGLLLAGGTDIEPSFYGAAKEPGCEATVPARDEFEIALAARALECDLPVLGICRGLQVLNVAAGGSLHQDLGPEGLSIHRRVPGSLAQDTFHRIEVAAGTLAAEFAGGGVQHVNSHHHQAVDRVGSGAVVSAHSVPDGVVEALEWPTRRYALGVQWHPESEHVEHAFSNFVSAAKLENA